MLTAAEEIIAQQTESCRILCPQCSASRKKKNKTLSITVNENEILYHCHHCPFTGCIPRKPFYEKYNTPPKVTPIPTQLNKSIRPIIEFFANRMPLSGDRWKKRHLHRMVEPVSSGGLTSLTQPPRTY
jgi:hypothetical protein